MHPINQLVDFVYGKESQTDDVGAVARLIRAHVTLRPALDSTPRWPDLDALKAHGRHFAPHATAAQIHATAVAAGVEKAPCDPQLVL